MGAQFTIFTQNIYSHIEHGDRETRTRGVAARRRNSPRLRLCRRWRDPRKFERDKLLPKSRGDSELSLTSATAAGAQSFDRGRGTGASPHASRGGEDIGFAIGIILVLRLFLNPFPR